MHRVVTLALPNVVVFDLAIPAQIFGHHTERHLYEFSVCAQYPGPVPSSTGFDIQAGAGLEALDAADTVIVPGFLPLDDPPKAVSDALRLAAERGARIASVCVGAFALAAAGLLDGRSATTHWAHADDLRSRFPAVTVRPDVLFVDEGQVLTSAGIAAGIDLCLHMYRNDHGAVAAADVARRMVAAIHRPGGQAQFMPRPLPLGGSQLAATCAWAIERIDQPLTVDDLASHSGYAPRTFARHFRDETGIPPLRWLTAQRLLEARRLLEATDLAVDEVARRCGLGTAANLRLHLARDASTTHRCIATPFVGRPRPSPRCEAPPRTPRTAKRDPNRHRTRNWRERRVDPRLLGKTVLVTGAGRGFGRDESLPWPAGARFGYQLGGPYQPPAGVGIVGPGDPGSLRKLRR